MDGYKDRNGKIQKNTCKHRDIHLSIQIPFQKDRWFNKQDVNKE